MADRALLLDLGGTVFLSGVELLGSLGAAHPAAAAVAARRGPLGTEPDPLWDTMIAEEITERDYWRRRSEEVGAALGRPGWPLQEFMHLLWGLSDDMVRPSAAAIVADARAAGIAVGALTNDLRAFHGDGAMSSHPLLSQLDVLVDGSDTGVLKPDPRAYAIAVERIGHPAEEIVFVDDMPWNIVPAKAAGMIALELDLSDPSEVFDRARAELGLAPAP
ncbi:HAD-IA family hydrolase [Pseudonocardia endophytica]|uniref:Putative hydrolase of the HAD superfamily n=1 Tax=Pseudonocardia endophytica TaxID=401976 RepID=A0A4R1HKQ5_PSEEN|nr:HAD-IA family hydrolase [Pseudonocardia endophytica]TCK21641.1 putative hydrolase of the HAD superfamily [Pseudonocardia endophytica]